jgi:hypothetical protein
MSNNVALVPTWEGYESLPQVQAFVLEALRWRPVVPIDGCFLDHEDREIDGTFLQESHTAPLGTSSGYVSYHTLDQRAFIDLGDMTEGSMYSCGCNCPRLSLVIILAVIHSCETAKL